MEEILSLVENNPLNVLVNFKYLFIVLEKPDY